MSETNDQAAREREELENEIFQDITGPPFPSQEGGRESKAHATGMVAAFQTAYEEGYKAGLAATPTEGYRRGADAETRCTFVFRNEYRAKFPCQRPLGHEGAHSINVIREKAEGEKA